MTCPMGTSDTAPKSLNLDNYTKKRLCCMNVPKSG